MDIRPTGLRVSLDDPTEILVATRSEQISTEIAWSDPNAGFSVGLLYIYLLAPFIDSNQGVWKIELSGSFVFDPRVGSTPQQNWQNYIDEVEAIYVSAYGGSGMYYQEERTLSVDFDEDIVVPFPTDNNLEGCILQVDIWLKSSREALFGSTLSYSFELPAL